MIERTRNEDVHTNVDSSHALGTEAAGVYPDHKYYMMMNPVTGRRYDIPMLSSLDPEYYFKYIYYMKINERSPDTFEKILRWD